MQEPKILNFQKFSVKLPTHTIEWVDTFEIIPEHRSNVTLFGTLGFVSDEDEPCRGKLVIGTSTKQLDPLGAKLRSRASSTILIPPSVDGPSYPAKVFSLDFMVFALQLSSMQLFVCKLQKQTELQWQLVPIDLARDGVHEFYGCSIDLVERYHCNEGIIYKLIIFGGANDDVDECRYILNLLI